MISMNNQPGFIPVISMFPSPIYPQFIPTILAPMIPYNLLPPLQNNNYPPPVSPESNENYEMPPGLTEQNIAYSSYGPYYVQQGNNNVNQGVEGFNLTISPYNFGKVDSQDPEFASILNSVYKSVWDDEKSDFQYEMSFYHAENIQPEGWKHLYSDYQQEKQNIMNGETEILDKLFENKREETRFGEYCENDEEDQINGTLVKFNDFQVIKQRLRLMDSYKVELKEGIFIWETVNNDSNSNKETINQSTTAQVHDFDFGIIPLGMQTTASNEADVENENKNEDYVSPLRELLDDEIEKEGENNGNKEESQENCLQDLMGKDLNDQKGIDIEGILLQLQKQNVGPFLIDFQSNTGNNENITAVKTEDNQQKKSKKKRKNKSKKNTKISTIPVVPVIENPEQPTLSNNSTMKSIEDLEHHQPVKTPSATLDEESEVQKAKRILAELEDAINNLDNPNLNPKPKKGHLVPDDLKSGSERIETNHSASTDFGEQSSMESGRTDQKLSRAQKKKLTKQKKQHLQSINDYIESTSAIHKIDSNYIAMLSSVLAEDPFALVNSLWTEYINIEDISQITIFFFCFKKKGTHCFPLKSHERKKMLSKNPFGANYNTLGIKVKMQRKTKFEL